MSIHLFQKTNIGEIFENNRFTQRINFVTIYQKKSKYYRSYFFHFYADIIKGLPFFLKETAKFLGGTLSICSLPLKKILKISEINNLNFRMILFQLQNIFSTNKISRKVSLRKMQASKLKFEESPQTNQKRLILQCFYHSSTKATYQLMNFNERINLCSKCAIKSASLGSTVQKLLNVQSSLEFKNLEIRNCLRHERVCNLFKSMEQLTLAYENQKGKLQKILKSHESRNEFFKRFYRTIINSFKHYFLEMSNSHKKTIESNSLWHQRTCESLILIGQVIKDLELSVQKFSQYEDYGLNSSESGLFYKGILEFYQYEFHELEQQMSHGHQSSVGNLCAIAGTMSNKLEEIMEDSLSE